MEHFLEIFKEYQGSNKNLIVYASKLKQVKKLIIGGGLWDQYDDMLELLHYEIEQIELAKQGLYYQVFDSDTEHKLCDNELI